MTAQYTRWARRLPVAVVVALASAVGTAVLAAPGTAAGAVVFVAAYIRHCEIVLPPSPQAHCGSSGP